MSEDRQRIVDREAWILLARHPNLSASIDPDQAIIETAVSRLTNGELNALIRYFGQAGSPATTRAAELMTAVASSGFRGCAGQLESPNRLDRILRWEGMRASLCAPSSGPKHGGRGDKPVCSRKGVEMKHLGRASVLTLS